MHERFKDKKFLGTDILPGFIEKSRKLSNSQTLLFECDDEQCLNTDYINKFDVVITRLLLQHVKKPIQVLENAYRYLKKGGHLIIIGTSDPAWTSSHEVPALLEGLRLLNKTNEERKIGNRKISLEILKQVAQKKGILPELYELVYSNISQEGVLIDQQMKFTSAKERKLYFNQVLLFLKILSKERNIPTDIASAHRDLQVYLHDENAWVVPALHFLILKKKYSPAPC